MMVGQGHYFELWDSGVWSAKLGQALAGAARRRLPAWRISPCERRRCTEPVLARRSDRRRSPSGRDGIYVDGTFGRGGHSRAILERLGPAGG